MDVAAAYTGLKFAKDALQAILSGKVAVESQTQILAALEKVGEAQDALFQLRDEMSRLQTENEHLRQELAAREDWNSAKVKYELGETTGGAVVYASKGAPHHYACPVCFEKKSIQILQDRRVMGGVFDCPNCKAEYPIKPIQSIEVETRYDPF